MKASSKIFIFILVAFALVGFVRWSEKHDAAIEKSASIYEQCVQENFRTTPAAYYAEHGEYPECE